jgi:hypothetical protein
MEIRALMHKGTTGSRLLRQEVKKYESRVFLVRMEIVGQTAAESPLEPSKLTFRSMKRPAFCGMVYVLRVNRSDPPVRAETAV